MIRKSLLLVLLAGTGTISALSVAPPALDAWPAVRPPAANPAVEQRVETLLSQMTLEQKVGQMIQAEIKSASPADVRKYQLGSVLNGGGSFPQGNKQASVQDWLALADAYHAASTTVAGVSIPVLWGTDAVHGHNNVRGAVLYPHNIGLGATGDADLVQAIAAATASEVKATGIDWVFAPTIAVASDFRWGRTYESYSEDPARVRAFAAPFVQGMQGKAGTAEFLGPLHTLATAKHFIGDGGTAGGVDQGDTQVSESELAYVHGQGYADAIAAGVQTVMVSFSSWNGQKMHGHRYLLTDVLKGRMGFDGIVVSDWNGIGQVSGCANADCVPAVLAGIDLFMVPEEWKAFHGNLLAAVKRGDVPMARIDDAVRRILRVKARAGLLDSVKPSARVAAASVGSAEHRALARRAVRESLVLLKNQGALLPLPKTAKVLVAGAGADDISRQSGGWSLTWQGTENSNADFPGATSLVAGIREAVKDPSQVQYSADGSYRSRPDVAVVVIGETPYAEGQGDRRDLNQALAQPADFALLKKLKDDGIPVVTVLLTGRPLWVNPELNRSDAFVVAWLPGTEGGGVADMLFRTVDGRIAYPFTGRLPFRWPAEPTQAQAIRTASAPAPLFPVGYGLDAESKSTVALLPEFGAAEKPSALTEMVLFERGPVAPWRLSLGDKGGWSQPVSGGMTQSANGTVTVTSFDRKIQEDSRRVVWNGSGIGQVFLQSAQKQDLSAMKAAQGALVIDMLLESRPTKPVELRIDCGYPCGAKANISEVLKIAPLNTWFSLSLDLKCFENAGADLSKVDSGMLIATGGKLSLGITGVRMVPGAAEKAVIRCKG